MNWITELFTNGGVAQTVLLFAIVIVLGLNLGKIKLFGISWGIAFVLFAGIFVGHFRVNINPEILHFMKEFGLIIFVYCIGLQVGPSFFASFKRGGVTLNILAVAIILLGVVATIAIHYIMGVPMQTMVGIMSGAITNTPGLGAAQQAFYDMNGSGDQSIALGYAVAYPLGVVGIISSIILIRVVFKIKQDKELESLNEQSNQNKEWVESFSIEIRNPSVFGKKVGEIRQLINRKFVISRVLHSDDKTVEIVSAKTILNEGDRVRVVTTSAIDKEAIQTFLGLPVSMQPEEWEGSNSELVSRRILITKPEINGKQIKELKLRSNFGVNITRVNRSGVDLVADPGLSLQVGDQVTVVGNMDTIAGIEKILGNQMKRLNDPNLAPIFIGIFLGVLLGSIPFAIPGIPQPLKLGLAGGPLIVAILVSIFGPKYGLVTYTTASANLMLRELGICLFLTCVGIESGENFVSTIVTGGYVWIGLGLIITVIPLLIVGIIGRSVFKLNYLTLMGLLAGSTTDPPALAYTSAAAENDAPAVAYTTVYPLTMFLRVLSAQLLILFFC